MRPVDLHPVTHRPAEQRMHRQADRLALDIPQRHLDGGIGALVQPAGRLDGLLVELGCDLLHRQRIPADQLFADGADHPAQRLAAAALVELRPTDQTRIGGDLEEREMPGRRGRVQVLDGGDLLALMSGAVSMTRAVKDPALQDEIAEAVRRIAQQLTSGTA